MKITWNTRNIDTINENARLALLDTAESIKTDLIKSQTMPFGKDEYKTIYGPKGKYAKNGKKYKGKKKMKHKGGTLQNDSTFVDDKRIIRGIALIVSDTPYARNMYFHPEYRFNKEKNPNAGGRWFDEYITGGKRNLPHEYFAKHLKRRMGQ